MNRVAAIKSRLARGLHILLLVILGATATTSEAALLNLADSPPYLITAVEPNVLLTFDDSGSMNWSYLPDTVSSISNTRRGCSPDVNGVYYDPTTSYDPPVKADGTPLNATPTNFTAAYKNGFNTGSGTVNLATSYQPSWSSPTSYVSCGFTGATTTSGTTGSYTSGRAAFYFTYDASLAGTGSCPNPAVTTNNNCYRLVQHNNAAAGGAWSAAQQQNFANWYSYYRTRNMTAKSATGRAFARFGTNVRVAAQHLNDSGSSTGSSSLLFPTSFSSGALKLFSGANRTDFFTRLYDAPASGSTPLREHMKTAGDYLKTQDPYLVTPGAAYDATANPELSCRQNFHIMMTDGYWNTPSGSSPGPVVTGNQDGGTTNGGVITALPDGTPYTDPAAPNGARPYADSYSSTLADAAFYYWATDLRPTLTNNVPSHITDKTGGAKQQYWNAVNDPATWQHMVNFTVGLVSGTLASDPANYTTTYNNLVSGTGDTSCAGTTGTSCAWPDPGTASPGTDGPTRIDDLWHAAIDSRGKYFLADNPAALVNALTEIVNNVADRISSASSVALNAGSLTGNNFAYQARFNSGDWTGQLLAFPIDASTGVVSTTSSWDAAVKLNGQHYDSGRSIITYNPSTRTGVPFRWTSLAASQIAALNFNPTTLLTDSQGAARLDYIRGDASNEGVGNNYRVRSRMCGATACPAGTNTGVLGDTVNSAPLYVGASPYDYPDSFEAQPYSTFKAANASRTPIIYIGANDGMLHGFDANTGLEKIAYVPSSVYNNLSLLPSSPYIHKYFVDGNSMAADVFINGAWRTILVGTLRKGGQGIFALDITDPSSFSEANASQLALWEFTDSNDADLGYTYAEPSIAKMHNGKWAVILGNGYNNSDSTVGTASASGHAVLYILFIEDGVDGTWSATDFVKIDTGVGSTATPNGLAAPAVVDTNGDGIADYIYAGDLRGNMWKFDVTSATTTDWTNTGNTKLVFAAGSTQPITERPQIGRHPAGQPGNMVYFGTGKYIETSDASVVGSATQTFYGIWDGSGVTSPTRSDLLQQTVLSTQTVNSSDFRVTSNNPMIWRVGSPAPTPSYIGWYMDLPTTGERQVSDPVLRGGRIIFTTVIPSSDPCSVGGDGWLMELNASNGGRLDVTPFDVNGDNSFTTLDLLSTGSGNAPASGQKFTGIISSPTIVTGGNPAVMPTCKGPRCKEQKLFSSSDSKIKDPIENPDECYFCRASWRQIR